MNSENIRSNRKKYIKSALVLLIVIALLLFCSYQNRHLETTYYTYKAEQLGADLEGYRIVQISDLHNVKFGKNNQKLVDRIRECEPDMIVLTGDLVDSNHTNVDRAVQFVDEIVKYRFPVQYAELSEKLKATEEQREAFISKFNAPIIEALKRDHINFEISGRVKSLYSIWSKMQRKQIPFEEVYDLFAIRIVFQPLPFPSEKTQCWQIFSTITDIYTPKPDRLRDWISMPKANGYEALHSTVMGPDGVWVEVQIRTQRMEEIAERGFAAHWKYKIGEGDEESELDAWLKTIKDILDNPEPSAIDFLSTLKLNLFSSEIVVFTPKGELITLPTGATVLDLAFSLHSQIGMHCIAGKVNHKLVPLQTELKSGDQVEVLTSKNPTATPEWNNFLATAKARTRLRKGLRSMRQPMINKGAAMLNEWLAANKLPDNNFVITKLQGMLQVGNRDDLCYQLGAEEVILGDYLLKPLRKAAASESPGIMTRLRKMMLRNNEKPEAEPEAEPINTKKIYRLENGENPNYRLAGCCAPIPGDDVMGFVGDDGVVEIHSLDCPRAQLLKAGYGSRIVATEWVEVGSPLFSAHVHIEGIDRRGILQEITQLISGHMGIDMRKLDIEAENEVFHADLWVRVSDTGVVADLCSHIKEIKGVSSAARIQ